MPQKCSQGGGKKKDSDERWPNKYFDIVCWPNNCEGQPSDVKEHDFVEVSGRLQQRHYVDKNGLKRSVMEIVATRVSLHPKEQKPITPDYGETPQVNLHGLQITDEDIPF